VKVAAAILSAADMSVDPCEDFYAYSCGGWERLNPIPDGRSSWSMFEKLWEANQLVMRNALDEGDRKDAPEAEKKALKYYRSCLDAEAIIERRGGK
jgi:predicted metalloendopeptidase